jgi:ferrous iron transport protein B
MSRNIKLALAGNPNAGKTTIFNNLTGLRQHVGNYPGVTVEKKEGFLSHRGYDFTIVDLPGIYGLSASSIDEIVARNFIVEEKPDVVIDVIDASNLERNLYLAVQLMELGAPLILALNMADMAQKQGLSIDAEKLSALLGVPIIMTVATRRVAMQDILDSAIRLIESKSVPVRTSIHYGREVDRLIDRTTEAVLKDLALSRQYPARWISIKLLEQDAEVLKRVKESPFASTILDAVEKSSEAIRGLFGDDPETIIAERRYSFISGACEEAVRRSFEQRHDISDMIDTILLNRLLGLPIFLLLIWLTFKFVFYASEPMEAVIEGFFGFLGRVVGGILPAASSLRSLIVDGVIGGVGSVLVFIPVIFLIFFAMSFLEDSGYLARAAFLMDKFMHKIGLHGRSFIPMLLGFGCSLPAIMATRTIDDERDRLTTILVIPFMSCGARLPIYVLFIGAFFPEAQAGNILFLIYLTGIFVAVIMAWILRRYLLRGPAAPFVMELPPYRIPTLRAILVHIWERGTVYLKKAGTVILAGAVIMWFLSNFPWYPTCSPNKFFGRRDFSDNRNGEMKRMELSYAGRIGRAIMPVFHPSGIHDWRLGVGFVGGFFAKEIVVTTLGTLYAAGEGKGEHNLSLRQSLRNAVRQDGTPMYTPLIAFSVMVFFLLYLPCISTVAIIRRETNSWRWPVFAILYTIAVAWVASFLIYRGGKLLGLK